MTATINFHLEPGFGSPMCSGDVHRHQRFDIDFSSLLMDTFLDSSIRCALQDCLC